MTCCARHMVGGRNGFAAFPLILTLILLSTFRAGAAHVDDVYWDDRFAPPGVAGTVHTIEVHGGDLYIGGEFNAVCGVKANNIARWRGGTWSALWTGTNGPVFAIEVAPDGSVYAGGYFTEAGGVAVNHIARWTGSAWVRLGDGAENGVHPDGNVRVIHARASDQIYVGGGFSRVAGSTLTAMNIALWNGQQWSALDWGVANMPLGGGEVNCIADLGGSLYVAGGFDMAGTANVSGFAHIARWDGTSWSKLGKGMGGFVHDMAVSQGDLVVTGLFFQAGDAQVGNIARWKTGDQTWEAIGEPATFWNTLHAVQAIGSDLFVAGDWDNGRRHFHYWNGTSWAPLNAQLRGDRYGDVLILDLAAGPAGELYLGGSFRTDPLFHEHFSGLAQFANNDVVLVGDYDAMWATGRANGLDGLVTAIATAADGSVYVGGEFSSGGGKSLSRLARWTGQEWEAVGGGVNNTVETIHCAGGDVYVGGQFNHAGGVECERIARWDGSQWHPLGLGLSTTCLSITTKGDTLYAGGIFHYAGGQEADYVAQWKNGVWSSMASGVDNSVTTLAAYGDDIYVGGYFAKAGVYTANFIASWGPTYWSILSPGVTAGTNDMVMDIASTADGIVIGGAFSTAGGTTAHHIVGWNGLQWVFLGDGIGLHHYETVQAVASHPSGEIFAGGNFTTFTDYSAYPSRVARYASNSWSLMGSGVAGGDLQYVRELGIGPNGEVFVGGDFMAAGEKGSAFFASWMGSLSSPTRAARVLSGVLPDMGDLDGNSDGVLDVSDIVRAAR